MDISDKPNDESTKKNTDKVPISADKMPIENLTEQQKKIYQYVKEKGKITSYQAELLLEVKQREIFLLKWLVWVC